MRIAIIQHEEIVGPGTIPAILRFAGVEATVVKVFDGIPLPDPSEYDGYIVLGGTMSVHETLEYPFLAEEVHWLRFAVDAGKPLLGICLGGQLLSMALGGKVTRCPEPEIGFFEIARSPEAAQDYYLTKMFPNERFKSFFWHSWQFSVPEGCTPLGSTELCGAMGFSRNGDVPVVGVQFHPEATVESVKLLVQHLGRELEFPPVWALDSADLASQTKLLSEQMKTILQTFIKKKP